jgi:tRNA-dihydrouridine synthase B
LEMLWEYKGDRGIRQARKHMTWYAKGFMGASELRGQLATVETLDQGLALMDRAIDRLASHGWEIDESPLPQLVTQ